MDLMLHAYIAVELSIPSLNGI